MLAVVTPQPPTGDPTGDLPDDDPLGGWLDRRTLLRPLYGDDERVAAKAGRTISLVIPTLDEAPTIASIVETARTAPATAGLLDQILVVDSGSTDGTAALARAAGAEVVDHRQVRPDLGARDGKGEGMWKSLALATGDLVVFVDGDLENFRAEWVARLVEPLLADDAVHLVKGSFDRPLGPDRNRDGGRVTQLVARPLLAAFFPDLLGLRQPLAGEMAARRDDLLAVPFAPAFGVDIGLLLDLAARWGAESVVQVELGERRHSHQSTAQLARMSVTLLYAVLRRAGVDGRAAEEFVQVLHEGDDLRLERFAIPTDERPPWTEVPPPA